MSYLRELRSMPLQAWIAEAVGLAVLIFTLIGG